MDSMKKTLRTVCAALLVAIMSISAVGCANAEDKSGAGSTQYNSYKDIAGVTEDIIAEIEAIKDSRDYFVYGMVPSVEAFYNETGEVKGYTGKICEWLTGFFGIPFKPEIYEWGDLLEGLESGEIDFTGELTATEERRREYFMTNTIAERMIKYIRLKNSGPLFDPESKRPPCYVFLRDTVTVDSVLEHVGGEYEVIFVDDYNAAYDLLKSGKADAFFDADSAVSAFDVYGDVVSEEFFPLIYEPVSFTTRNPDLQPIIAVVETMLEDGGIRYLTELYNAGRDEYIRHKLLTQLTDEELAYLADNETVSFAAEYDSYPICFYNDHEKQWQGIAIDVLREVEGLTGLKFEIVNRTVDDWPVLIKMLEDGDAAIVSELIRSDVLEGRFIWPENSVMEDHYALLSKSELSNISTNEISYMKVGLIAETEQAEMFNQWFPDQTNTVMYSNSDEAFNALALGEVDLVMASQNKLLMWSNYNEIAGYKVNYTFNHPYDSTFGFNKNEAVLCSIVDKAIELINTEEIVGQWTRMTYDYREKVTRAQMPWLVGTALLLTCVILLFMVLFRRNRDEGKRLENIVRKRTAELNNQQMLMYVGNKAAAIMLEADASNYLTAISKSMEMVGKCAKVDSVRVWQNHLKADGELYFKQICRWKQDNTAYGDYSPEFVYRYTLPKWEKLLALGESVNGSADSFTNEERSFLMTEGIQSILVVPVFLHDKFWGFVSFEDFSKKRIFPESEEYILRSWALLAVSAIQRNEITMDMQDTLTKLEAVISNYKGIIWSVNKDGIITTFNGKYLKTDIEMPFSPVGRKLENERSKNKYLEIIDGVEKTLLEGSQEWVKEIDGKVFHSYTSPMFGSGNELIGVVGSSDDVTGIIKLQRELETALKAAKYASRAKSSFLASMSHEIRTPMNAIIGMTELALREDISPAATEHMLTIKQAGAHLLTIINDILDLSKIEMGRLEIVPSDYFLTSLLNDVISIIRMRVLDTQLMFAVNINNKLPNELRGDEIRIRQILINILGNAVKYTENGFILLTVSGEITGNDTMNLKFEIADSGRGVKPEDIENLFKDFVQLDMANQKGIEGTGLGLSITKYLIEAMKGDISVVSEYGKGSTFTVILPQKIRANVKLAEVDNPDECRVLIYETREIYANSMVFTLENLEVNCTLVTDPDRFYEELPGKYSFIFISSQLYKEAREKLSELKSGAKTVILAEFGESISDSDLSVIVMPVTAISIANTLNGFTDNYEFSIKNEQNVRFIAPDAQVLVVDDINTNLKVTGGLMLPYKMQIDFCMSGMEAIEMAKTKDYDLILMDHMMPQMDGIEAMQRIRALGGEGSHYENMPIVALTANAISDTKEKLLSSGFDDYLSKPINTIWLNTILETWIPKEKQKRIIAAEDKSEDADSLNIEDNFPIIIEGVDVKKGVSLSGGSANSFFETLTVFYEDGYEKILEIEKSLEDENIPLYTIYVHALKSALASIGADRLSEDAKNLEAAGKQEDMSFIEEHTGKLLKDLIVLLEGVESALLKQQRSENISEGVFDTEELKAELIRLKAAIELLDAGAINSAVDKLLSIAKPDAVTVGAVRDISKQILLYEYEEAVALIDMLL